MEYKLTEYSHGAGCGCKLSPGVLSDILGKNDHLPVFDRLLVGNETSDDAAVVDLDGQTAIVSTTDFFMPIVDDPQQFGRIAAANAISDIYAMGAEPLMAIAILGWPIDKIPASVAGQVLEGGRMSCTEAGIPLAGGHSIDSPEPIFGLAVTGRAPVTQVKKNKDGRVGDLLYLTKPLGIGTVTTAQKKKLAEKGDLDQAIQAMLTLNKIGQTFGTLPYVHAVTDVTGFGLAGHLLELCEASRTSAIIHLDQLPVFDFAKKYIEKGCIPGGTKRNWATYGHRLELRHEEDYLLLADPQTSGGLLVSVDPQRQLDFEALMKNNGMELRPIGILGSQNGPKIIRVE